METLAPKIIFWLFAALMLGSALVVVHGKNLVRSAFALLATFFSAAVFYALLGADFLAGAQVLIYVGGILDSPPLRSDAHQSGLRRELEDRDVPGRARGAGLGRRVRHADAGHPQDPLAPGLPVEEGPTTGKIGNLLTTTYLLPFEVASVLLLVALLGAAMLVRRRSDL